MNCRYCRASNTEDEHRCHRCGRRLHSATGPVPAGDYVHGAVAHDIQTRTAAPVRAPQPEVVARNQTAPQEAKPKSVYQRPLFGTSEMGPVLPFEAFTGTPERPVRQRTAARPRVRRPAPPGQHSLDFNAAAAPVHPAAGRVSEGVVFCDAEVAPGRIEPSRRFSTSP